MVREELDTLGKTIKFYRLQAGLTQAQLAELIYTKKSDISEIENDKRTIAIPRLLDIANAVNVHPAKLFMYIGKDEDVAKQTQCTELLKEISMLQDMELVGMVMEFVQMLKRSSFNVEKRAV